MRLHRWSSPEGNRGRRWHAYLYCGDQDSITLLTGRLEANWASGSKLCGVELGIGDESMIGGSLQIPKMASAYWGIGSPALDRWLWKRGTKRPRDIHVVSVSVHDKAVWWEFWHPRHEWKSSTPRWRCGNWHPIDSILGKQKHSKEVIEGPVAVEIPMPEGGYPATVAIELCRWKRPRWPWPSVELKRADVDIPGGIGVPGKGENSWDCGDDAIYRSSFPANSVEAAIGSVVGDVLRTRKRYGGSHLFTPSEVPR